MQNCVILNNDYSYLNTVSWQKAMRLLVKGKATVLKYSERIVKTAEEVVMKIPAVMKLIKLIRTIYRTRVPFSKKNVMIRDGYTCQYCGASTKLTIDHVIPVSRGGKSDFENCVSACQDCNNKKSNRLPSECHMYLKKKPISPTISEFTRIKAVKAGVYDLLKDLGVY
jgi:5-methylcytosine-specific restriction endonuclease McrA